jgi:hypothetical protein
MEKYLNYWQEVPFYSSKFDVYFNVYDDVFKHLKGTAPTFIEIGIQSGGSLFAWKKFFGEDSRIIGIDLNPKCKEFEKFGFEIYIGDTGDENFLKSVFKDLKNIDAILDDGGHLYLQQINILEIAAKNLSGNFLVAIEDTSTSFYKEFLNKSYKNRTFLDYAKGLSDMLHIGFANVYPSALPEFKQDHSLLDIYNNLYSINFYKGIVVFDFQSSEKNNVNIVKNNKPIFIDQDFRDVGIKRKKILWPDVFKEKKVFVGQTLIWSLYYRIIKFQRRNSKKS